MYVSTGHLVYVDQYGTLHAAPFDETRMEVTGNSVPIVEGVHVTVTGSAGFSLANNGRLVYLPATGLGTVLEHSLVWVDRTVKRN